MTWDWTSSILALQRDRFNDGLATFQWGLTMAGVGIVIVGLAILLQKAKEGDSQGAGITHRVIGVLVTALGIGIIAYAWLGFEKM